MSTNKEKLNEGLITALIDLKITPSRGEGFDKVAARIYKYPQVRSLYLMSGAYDLAVEVCGNSMDEISLFVAEKLAAMEAVVSTATHFVMKVYKRDGVAFHSPERDTREVITL